MSDEEKLNPSDREYIRAAASRSEANIALEKLLDYFKARDSERSRNFEINQKEMKDLTLGLRNDLQIFIKENAVEREKLASELEAYRERLDRTMQNHELRITRQEIYDKIFFSGLGAFIVVVPTFLAIIFHVV